MVLCIHGSGHVAIVINRSKKTTKFITTIRKKRKIQIERNVDFDRYYKLTADDSAICAGKWLSSPIKMTLEVKKELEMIALKKNVIVGKFDSVDDVPKGAEAIAEAGDLKGRSLKSLAALYNKLAGDSYEQVKKFETEDEATAAVFALLEAYESPVKEKKEKAVKEKIVLVEVPAKIGKQSVITVVVENPKRAGSGAAERYDKYVNGGTVAGSLAAGVRIDDIRWDIARGFVTVELVDDIPVEKSVKEPKPVKEVSPVV